MPWREVERVEVVPRRLDLAAVDDRVAEPEEDVLDLAPDLRDEVKMPAPDRGARHRDVDALLGEAPVELGTRDVRLPRVDRRLEPLPERVQRHARLAVANLAQRELQLALAAEELDTDVLDLLDRRGRLGSCERGVLECLGVHGSAEVTNVPVELSSLRGRANCRSPERSDVDADEHERTSQHEPDADRLVVEPCGQHDGHDRDQDERVRRT